jgi:hypothetical protein
MNATYQGQFILAVAMGITTWLSVGCGSNEAVSRDPTIQFETAVALVEESTAEARLQATQAANPTAQFETAVALINATTAQVDLSATSTPAPTAQSPTIESPSTSGQDSGWNPLPITTLCLEIDQSYPQIAGEFSQPIREAAEAILAEMDVAVMEAGGDCESTLEYSLTGEALWVQWENTPECYNGAEVSGVARLAGDITSGDRFPLAVEGKEPIPSMNFSCTEQPADAPWERAWTGALLDGLAAVWGPQVLITALDMPDLTNNRAEAVADTALKLETSQMLEVMGHMLELENPWIRERSIQMLGRAGSEAVPVLIQALDDESGAVRSEAAEKLRNLHSDAIEAVPALILRLDDDVENVRSDALMALRWITEEYDLGEDAAEWQAWWEEQHSQ